MLAILKYLILPFAIAHLVFDFGRQNTYIPLAISIVTFYLYVFITLKRMGYFKKIFSKKASIQNEQSQSQTETPKETAE